MKSLKLASVLALAVIVSGCVSLGNPTDKSPSQLRAEREARRAERPLPMTENIQKALGEKQLEEGVAVVNSLPDSPM